jgi:hypothetical protein
MGGEAGGGRRRPGIARRRLMRPVESSYARSGLAMFERTPVRDVVLQPDAFKMGLPWNAARKRALMSL